jgi:hypothetical protein
MTSSITPSWPKLTGRQEFEFLADLVMSHSTGDHTNCHCATFMAERLALRTIRSFRM